LIDYASEEEPVPDEKIEITDCVHIGYTAGTTGRPKGVVTSHYARTVPFAIKNFQYAVDEMTRWLLPGPMYHEKPLANVLQVVFARATLIAMKRFAPEDLLKIIDKEKMTHAFMVPAMFDAILALPDDVKNKYDVSSMRKLVSAAAPLLTQTKAKVLDFFKNAGLHEFYGSTELALCTDLRPEDQTRKVRCAGLPSPGIEVKILDEEGNEVPRGEIGILYARNASQFDGYYKNPEATKEVMTDDGFNTSEDIARMDEEGYIYIVDRKKDMILRGGENIYSAEVEEVLKGHPKLSDIAVIGVPDERLGEAVTAVVVVKEGEKVTEGEIIEWCKGKMSRKKVPASIDFVPQLPRSPAGKVLKRLIREPYWKDQERKI